MSKEEEDIVKYMAIEKYALYILHESSSPINEIENLFENLTEEYKQILLKDIIPTIT